MEANSRLPIYFSKIRCESNNRWDKSQTAQYRWSVYLADKLKHRDVKEFVSRVCHYWRHLSYMLMCFRWNIILGVLAKLRIATITLVMTVCLSVCKHSATIGEILMKFGIRKFFENKQKKILVFLKESDKDKGYTI